MNRFILLAVIASVTAEAPGGYSSGGSISAGRNFAFGGNSGSSGSGLNEYVDQALLERVAAVLASGGDGTARGQDNEGSQYVDESLFQRVASALGDSDSGSSSQGGYGAPARSGSASLGQPEPAQRIAEWDLSSGSETRQSSFDGGYQQAPAAPAQGYSQGPSRSSSSSASSFQLGNPERAQEVTSFDASQQQASSGFSNANANANRGGY